MSQTVVCPQCGYETLVFSDDAHGCPECSEVTDAAPDGVVMLTDGSPVLVAPGSALAERGDVDV